jgi:glycosyltransferase involved in cell wall biosynthesis
MPAYNEERNLDRVLDAWLPTLRRTCGWFVLCCIDDGSTDGTPELVARRAAGASELAVVRTENAGHGAACMVGYRTALLAGVIDR